jgi:DNA replication protein DnaC
MAQHPKNPTPKDLRERILAAFAALKIPLRPEQFDATLSKAEHEGLTYQEFLHQLIGEQAAQRRERAIASRIRDAKFRESKTLSTFDWQFNAKAINRTQIEELAMGEFIRRHENVVIVGQSGVGKSHILQAVGQQACVQGWRVRYVTSGGLLEDLRASLADQTLPDRVKYYAKFDLLIIDEFGFDRLERKESPESASLLYKVIDARHGQRSTALVTNIDFEAWGAYLGDPPLAMALLDRVVDGAIILKIAGKSYRAYRGRPGGPDKPPPETKSQ